METSKEWFGENPIGTMNDYYSYLRKNGKVNSAPVSCPIYNYFQIPHTQFEDTLENPAPIHLEEKFKAIVAKV